MSKTIWTGAFVLGAVVAGALYFGGDSVDQGHTASESAPDANAHVESAAPTANPHVDSESRTVPGSRAAHEVSKAVPDDPRLAALRVSPDNGFIEFAADSDGRVIKEVDNDPSSPSFKKPLREYMYSGDQVIGVTAYHYAGDQIQITRTVVSYKPDGSVDQYQQSTRYEREAGPARGE